MDENHMQGLWALDGAGRIGRVTGRVHDRGLHLFVGEALAGGHWQSACPYVLGPYEQRLLNSLRKPAA